MRFPFSRGYSASSAFSVLKSCFGRAENSAASSGFTRAGRSRAAKNAFHCLGEAENSARSARMCWACKQALSRMKSVRLTPEVSAPVRISLSCRSVARRLMRRLRTARDREVAIIGLRLHLVRTLYVFETRNSSRGSRGPRFQNLLRTHTISPDCRPESFCGRSGRAPIAEVDSAAVRRLLRIAA